MLATKERSYYRAVCNTSKHNVRQFFQQAGVFTPPSPSSQLPPCSLASLTGPDIPGKGTSGHYCQHSVDYAGMLACPQIAHL